MIFMGLDFVRGKLAERIGGFHFGGESGYKFEKIKKAVREVKLQSPDLKLIDLGVGDPDDMADEGIVAKLSAEAKKQENRGYADNGILEFQQAATTYLSRVFQVDHVDPASEILHSIGTKSALSILPSCFINPKDLTIMPVPGYPILATHTRYLGGEVYETPLVEENAYLPDLEKIPQAVRHQAKLMYLNYPHSPTGATADESFFERVVHFAKQNQIIVVHDAAYASLTYGTARPVSFLSVPGAKEVGVELHSLSKSHNMTGWRIGFAAGHSLIVKALGEAKSNYDSGQFIPIQKAAIYALEHMEIIHKNKEKYSRRLDFLVAMLMELQFPVSKPKGTFFLYIRSPRRIRGGRHFETAEAFSQFLIEEKGIVTVPWDEAGHYIRLSVTFEARTVRDEKSIVQEIRERLLDIELEF
jgi:LL-diaminopimelate aminotransferase